MVIGTCFLESLALSSLVLQIRAEDSKKMVAFFSGVTAVALVSQKVYEMYQLRCETVQTLVVSFMDFSSFIIQTTRGH